MHGVENFIRGDSADLIYGQGTWTVDDGGNEATVSVTQAKMAKPGCGSLKIEVPGQAPYNPLIVSCFYSEDEPSWNWLVPEKYTGWPIRGSVFVYCTTKMYVAMGVSISNNDNFTQTSISTGTVVIEPLKWTLLSTEEETAFSSPGDTQIRVSMTLGIAPFSGTFSDDTIYIGCANITTPLAVTENTFAAETWARLPQYLKDADRDQSDPDFPLLRFLDVATHPADEVFETWDDIRYLPADVLPEVKESALVYPPDGDPSWYPWLARILGFNLLGLNSGFTTWAGLIAGLDLDASGDASWAEWETNADSGDPGTDVSWGELEEFNPAMASASTLAYWQWQLQTAAFGIKGGTVASIKAAARNALTGSQTVTVKALADGNPWLIRLIVSPDEALSLTAVIEAARPAVPAGFDIDAVYGPAEFATVAAVAAVNASTQEIAHSAATVAAVAAVDGVTVSIT